MRRNRALRGVKIVLMVALAVTVFGFVVMHLWNWLLPGLFGWPTIRFGQALGLLLLSRILLGGFRGFAGRGMHWRGRMMERWEQMTPEEREKFRQGMRGRCGSFEPPAAQANP